MRDRCERFAALERKLEVHDAEGLHYAMRVNNHGIVGTPQAIDLNKIASPPGNMIAPPYTAGERNEIARCSRWIDSLVIC